MLCSSVTNIVRLIHAHRFLFLSNTAEYTGKAVVQEVFNIGGTGNIAGSKFVDGVLKKNGNMRVMRGDKILTEAKIRTLRSFKAKVESIEEGNECGIVD